MGAAPLIANELPRISVYLHGKRALKSFLKWILKEPKIKSKLKIVKIRLVGCCIFVISIISPPFTSISLRGLSCCSHLEAGLLSQILYTYNGQYNSTQHINHSFFLVLQNENGLCSTLEKLGAKLIIH